ncbi:RNA-binding S4 domain-containing protein [Planctomycetes bacterium K23_9]|uniref:Ribosome-associated protein n=1 Tax=Stieleria marina TaxID=1930275 RepID=A0A517NY63_9BACT|nr:ribosome-associated protein [Planctomycetes bacterium K23_9]
MTESENPASDENPTPVDLSASKPSIIRLDDFLKRHGLVGTGGEAKIRIQTGEVTVNGEVETRRRKQLSPGDVVEAVGETITVTPDCFE